MTISLSQISLSPDSHREADLFLVKLKLFLLKGLLQKSVAIWELQEMSHSGWQQLTNSSLPLLSYLLFIITIFERSHHLYFSFYSQVIMSII